MKPIRRLAATLLLCAAGLAHGQAAPAASTAPAEPVKLADAVAGWKASLGYDPLTGTGSILRGSDLVRFKLGLPLYSLAGGEALPAPAVVDTGAALVLPSAAVAAIGDWFARRDAERASRFSVAAILIDPGHGGKDPGAIGEHGTGRDRARIAEKDVVLSVALDLKARLELLWPGKTILITRTGDTYPSLDERVDMGNAVPLGLNEAIIYVSIHANASFNKAASGYEVWYLNPDYRRTVVDPSAVKGVEAGVIPILNAMLEEEYTTESVFLATAILDGLQASVGALTQGRGARPEEWFVVRNARMPSVLVEVGFVTNEAEAARLADPSYLRKLGEGIYNGIVSFVDHFERRKAASSP